jgi:hypothetical protein
MKQKTLLVFWVIISWLLLIVFPDPAQSFAVTWWSVDGGGGTSSGGSFALSGTIGQADAGVLSGGAYTLTVGFWAEGPLHLIYLPLILRK